MREPWLFWSSLAILPFAIACFVIAMRVTSERLTRALEVAGEIIAGVALPLAGYEGGFRYAAKDIWELKAPDLRWTFIHYTRSLLHSRCHCESVRQVICVCTSIDLTNRWSQPLAAVVTTLNFMKQFSMFATLASASGRSAWSR